MIDLLRPMTDVLFAQPRSKVKPVGTRKLEVAADRSLKGRDGRDWREHAALA
jgi:hypothetical protein